MEKVLEYSGIYGAVSFSHLMLSSFIKEGDIVVDATCGNGGDTVFLASLVGRTGRVFSFDIQLCAIETAFSAAKESGFSDQIEFIHAGHENMAEYIDAGVKGVVFNLGYLPGADKSIITRAQSTLAAMQAAIKLLAHEAVIALSMYTGHESGDTESAAVESFVSNLSPHQYNVWKSFQLNRSTKAPYNIFLQKI